MNGVYQQPEIACHVVMPLRNPGAANGAETVLRKPLLIGEPATERMDTPQYELFGRLAQLLLARGVHVAVDDTVNLQNYFIEEVYNLIFEARLMVFDLSGLHPNVLYRLGLRHASGLPTIVFATQDTVLPSELGEMTRRVNKPILYGTEEVALQTALQEFGEQLDAIQRAHWAPQVPGVQPFPYVGRPVPYTIGEHLKLFGVPLNEVNLRKLHFFAHEFERTGQAARASQGRDHRYASLDDNDRSDGRSRPERPTRRTGYRWQSRDL